MSYTINKTNGSIFAVVQDGTINTDSSQIVVGKNYAGYGEFLGENFIRLLENAADKNEPDAPLTGQLWFDTNVQTLKVFNGSNFKNLGAAGTGIESPLNPVIGDLWYDTGKEQLNVYTGTDWLLIGPSYEAGFGESGSIVKSIVDTSGNQHIIVELLVNDVIVAITSKDAEYEPDPAITGFPTIKPGIQLAEFLPNGIKPIFEGTAREALNLVDANGLSIPTSSFVRNDTNVEEMLGSLWVKNSEGGIRTGATGELQLKVSNGEAHISNSADAKAIVISAKKLGNTNISDIISINTDGDGMARALYDLTNPSTIPDDTLITKAYVDTYGGGDVNGLLAADGSILITGILKPEFDGSTDLGTPSAQFNTVYATTFQGTSTQAKYADLAERFETDKSMIAGTVVELGGDKEITMATEQFSDNVFGVISTQAAYLMNSDAGDDTTHPAVAMHGRVPVRVIGKVKKGERLVSAGNGLAQSVTSDDITAFNVIGRSLENKDTNGEGVIEAFVRIN